MKKRLRGQSRIIWPWRVVILIPHYFGSMIHIMIHQDYFTRYFVIPLLNYILQVKILKFWTWKFMIPSYLRDMIQAILPPQVISHVWYHLSHARVLKLDKLVYTYIFLHNIFWYTLSILWCKPVKWQNYFLFRFVCRKKIISSMSLVCWLHVQWYGTDSSQPKARYVYIVS